MAAHRRPRPGFIRRFSFYLRGCTGETRTLGYSRRLGCTSGAIIGHRNDDGPGQEEDDGNDDSGRRCRRAFSSPGRVSFRFLATEVSQLSSFSAPVFSLRLSPFFSTSSLHARHRFCCNVTKGAGRRGWKRKKRIVEATEVRGCVPTTPTDSI